MGKLDNIHDSSMNRISELPHGVHVVASADMLAGLDAVRGGVVEVECAIDAPLPMSKIINASIVVIEVDPSSRNSLERIERLRSEVPSVPVIAGLAKVDIATSRQLLRRGVSDIVALPFSIDELVTSIVDTAAQIQLEEHVEAKLAPVIAVMKSIGGSGATTVATHLAAQMALDRGSHCRSCIIDLDLQAGDAASYLGCSPRLTLSDLIDADGRLDEDLLRSVACEGDEHVFVIPAPADIVPIESIDFERLMRIITLARRHFDVVLLDLPSSFTNWSLSTAFAADLTVMVGTLTIPSLRHAKRQLDFLVSMGMVRANILIALNRVEKRLFKAIDVDDAAGALKHPIAATITDDPNLLRTAQDQGELVDSIQKRSKFSKEIAHLAQLVDNRLVENG
ncbi:AAA family ATPase [Erythrobacteraceae bacterium E2-1 Yellow Sea]|nr:AAA family ATPase [Erythrobacteraceae bacterium E2-1 Yellow Sea]